jgi:simple sugar transport system permease protein
MLFAALHGIAAITFRGNQLISGVALNFLASGITVLVAQALFGQGGRTPPLTGDARFNPITLPFAETLKDVPILGPMYYEVISGHSVLVYLALAMVPLSWWLLYRTRFGLRLRAVGENPASVDTAGVSVVGLRFAAVAITGVLCGIAGAYMATALQAGFGREMTAGRGYIALAALIFAKWRPWQALGATMLFGFFQALALRPDVVEAVAGRKVPVSILDALCADHSGAGGFCWQSHPATCGRRTLCKGTLNAGSTGCDPRTSGPRTRETGVDPGLGAWPSGGSS